MKKRVNLGDIEQAKELLGQLYGHKTDKDSQGSTISVNPTPTHTPREERGHMVFRMGLQPAGNQRSYHSHTERGEKVVVCGQGIGKDGTTEGR